MAATPPIKFTKEYAGSYRWEDGGNEIMITRMDSYNCYFNRRIGTWAVECWHRSIPGQYRPEVHEAEYRTLADAQAAANITVQDWEWEKQQAEVAV